jgi:serine/threonine protein kinase
MSPLSSHLPEIEDALERFEEAWIAGGAPELAEFLPATCRANGALRRRVLIELIHVDLDQRWRRAAAKSVGAGAPPERWKLEEYVERHPELGLKEQLPLELLRAEYEVRHLWGDRPGQAEYLHRFPAQAKALAAAFAQDKSEPTLAQGANRLARINGAEEPAARAAPIASLSSLIETIRAADLLPRKHLNALMQECRDKKFEDGLTLCRELMRRDWLTPYQANQLLLGRAADLLQGAYLLLERLGEGGMGTVFKARHRKMDRLVALKLLRPELSADAEAVGRFHRETELIGRLKHPNLVHAYDAGLIGTALGLVMEYVEGTDLSRLVKKQGPLPVALACAFVRQTAVGLQYIHERGLVHRDIKPANLMVTSQPGPDGTALAVVKILDLGLARLRPRTGIVPAGASLSDTRTLTMLSGVVMMGTPDYLAPEQALDFHGADIRCDIYALGCTLHFLLTGQAPFAGASLPQKLIKHQQEEPPALAEFRSDVPESVAVVLRRMIAKRPADRFQTPGEVALALNEASTSTPRATRILGPAPSVVPVAAPVGGNAAAWGAGRAVQQYRRRRLLLALFAISLSAVALGISLLPWMGPSTSAPVASTSRPDAPPAPIAYDPAKEFSATKNPNGHWSYGTKEKPTDLSLGPMTGNSGAEFDTWTVNEGPAAVCHRKLADGTAKFVDISGNRHYLDEVGFHPGGGKTSLAVLRFTPLTAGHCEVSAQFFARAVQDKPGGAHVYVTLNKAKGSQVLWQHPDLVNTTTGVKADIPRQQLAPGDSLDFMVGPNRDNDYSRCTTGARIAIRLQGRR